MDDPLLVRRFERVGNLTRGCHGFRDRHGAALQAIGQGLAVNQFEHQRPNTAGILEAMNGRDVRVIQAGQQLRFPLETRQAIGILRKEIGEDLQGDVASQSRVARAIDLAHPTCTDERDDLERAEARAGDEGHVVPANSPI